jgi:uncharacterized phiE125 gp8 family phage protein
MATKISVLPTEEPINLEDAKAHLRVDHDEDDDYILNLIMVACQYAETVTHRALITQTWIYYLDDFPDDDYIEIPYPPLQSVTSLKYTDYNNTQTEWANTNYIVDTASLPGKIVLAYGISWPTATLYPSNPIEITYVCGYGTPDDIPESIKQGMKLDIGDMYENRETIIVGQPIAHLDALERIYMPYRVWNF